MIHTQIKKAAVDCYAALHTLRHSYASYLLEPGEDLSHIQEALSHNSTKAIETYTHIQDTNRYCFRSPIDDMDI